MSARLFSAVGALGLVVSLALLIVTCNSVPGTSLPAFTVTASRTISGTVRPQIRVQFGLWGWCQTTYGLWISHPEVCEGTGGPPGYDPGRVMRPLVSNFPSTRVVGGMADLTQGLVMPAAATATTGVAALFGVAALLRRSFRTPNILLGVTILTALSVIFAAAGVGCLFALFEKVRKGTPATSVIQIVSPSFTAGNTYRLTTGYGPVAWALVGALVALLTSSVVCALAWLSARREDRHEGRRWSDGHGKTEVSYHEGGVPRGQ
ncbi:hypothetical protein CSOJ01_11285 [Colletotrichum sojae]|uniref:Uncharacterized protein n=1 Tax=Colletotrichum sojae TaxID=2175907 RepID=A0A8H6MP06_9PEZI|nr:hypothetical protein CSOJ01_11285 [Colletotrichum sojae]